MTRDPLADAIDTAGRGDPRAARQDTATVTALNSDGTVNLTVRGRALHRGVPCLASYNPRAKGDRVLVAKVGVAWYVLGKTGAPPGTAGSAPLVTWGDTPPPGSGWQQAQTVWVRGNTVYVQTGTGSGGGSAPPPSHGTEQLDPTDQGTWRGGQRRDGADGDVATQGEYGGWGNNTGAWFYGNALHDAVALGSVDKVTLTLARSADKHGSWGDVPVHLSVHQQASPDRTNTPGQVAGPWTVTALQLGEQQTITVPGAAVDALAATGRGFRVHTDGGRDYLIFDRCGHVTVTYQ